MQNIQHGEPLWRENCRDCDKPMWEMMGEPGDTFTGTLGTLGFEDNDDPEVKQPKSYEKWVSGQEEIKDAMGNVIQQQIPPCEVSFSSPKWYCEGCETLWSKVVGPWWTKVQYTGKLTIVPDPVIVMQNLILDPGPKPFPGATKCPSCHIWRELVVPENLDRMLSDNMRIHRCPKCFTGDMLMFDPQLFMDEMLKQADTGVMLP